ncbi:MAG TPA: entericidin A/B family lipoprotein [Stellaceae bacterium]|nr:entericidin A/B family lipoprotein [Stellaceae bacterium]
MKKRIVMMFLSLFVLTGAAVALSACNTMAGLGEDTSAAGHALTNSATQTQTNMQQ